VQTADTGPGAPGPDAGTDAHADVAGAPDDAEALERVRSEPSDGPAVRSHDDDPDTDSAGDEPEAAGAEPTAGPTTSVSSPDPSATSEPEASGASTGADTTG